MDCRVTLSGALEARLRTWLSGHPDGHERGAFVLFRKLDREVEGLERSVRYIAVDAVELDESWVENSSRSHVRFKLRKLPDLYFRCEQEGLELGFVHSHPDGASNFSIRDTENELTILRGYTASNGPGVHLVALVLCEGMWFGRVRRAAAPETALRVRHVAALSDRIDIWTDGHSAGDQELLARQEAAFGKPFNQKLQSLRVAVVGLGGTGSPLATLLARSGVGELILIDGDRLEVSNLNRVRGYRRSDVKERKATSLAAYVRSLGLNCDVAYVPDFLNRSPTAVDAIASSDVVFGCTDDVAGRDLLNQATYYYALGFIDVGLTGALGEDSTGAPYLRDHRGRISTILPESGACLRCQRVVTDEKLKYEQAIRERPELADLDPETLRREYYLSGGRESAPGVGPFTSATADFGVAALMDLIRPFRRLDDGIRRDNVWIDFVHLNIYSNQPLLDDDCFCCGTNGLRPETEGPCRLGMPLLGRTP